MGGANKNKKAHKDFKTRKRKVGHKALPNANDTKTNFKTRKIVLPNQSIVALGGDKESLTMINAKVMQLCVQATHYSSKMRASAFTMFKDLLSKQPQVLHSHMSHILKSVLSGMTDEEKESRKQFYAFARYMFVTSAAEDLSLNIFTPLLTGYITSALAHVRNDVRYDALLFFDFFVPTYPSLFATVPILASLAPSFLSVLGKSAKDSLVVTRALEKMLSLYRIVANNTNVVGDYSRILSFRVYDSVSTTLEDETKTPKQQASSSSNTMESTTMFRRSMTPSAFMREVFPLLIEKFLECSPTEEFNFTIGQHKAAKKQHERLSLMKSSLNCMLTVLYFVSHYDTKEDTMAAFCISSLSAMSKHVFDSFPIRTNSSDPEHHNLLEPLNQAMCLLVMRYLPHFNEFSQRGQQKCALFADYVLTHMIDLLATSSVAFEGASSPFDFFRQALLYMAPDRQRYALDKLGGIFVNSNSLEFKSRFLPFFSKLIMPPEGNRYVTVLLLRKALLTLPGMLLEMKDDMAMKLIIKLIRDACCYHGNSEMKLSFNDLDDKLVLLFNQLHTLVPELQQKCVMLLADVDVVSMNLLRAVVALVRRAEVDVTAKEYAVEALYHRPSLDRATLYSVFLSGCLNHVYVNDLVCKQQRPFIKRSIQMLCNCDAIQAVIPRIRDELQAPSYAEPHWTRVVQENLCSLWQILACLEAKVRKEDVLKSLQLILAPQLVQAIVLFETSLLGQVAVDLLGIDHLGLLPVFIRSAATSLDAKENRITPNAIQKLLINSSLAHAWPSANNECQRLVAAFKHHGNYSNLLASEFKIMFPEWP